MTTRFLTLLIAAPLLALPARADVTLVHNAVSGDWTLENGLMRVTVNSAGRVPSLIKKTGPGAGTNQAVPSYPAFLERVNGEFATVRAAIANPDGDDSAARRSLRFTETVDTGAGVIFDVKKTYRLLDNDKALEAELSFRNTSGTDWTAVNPRLGAESLVYVAPGGSAPAGDRVQVIAQDGPDVAAPSGTTWWGTGAVPRPALAQGFLAAVDDTSGVSNLLTWDLHEHTANSLDGVPAASVYRGSNRFQLEAWRTHLPAGQTVSWKQYLIVDDGIPFVSFAAHGSLIGGIVTDAPTYRTGETASATFRLNSARRDGAFYDLRNIRLLDPLGSSTLDLHDIPDVYLPPGESAAPVISFVVPEVPDGAYTLTADIFSEGVPLGAVISTPVNITAPAGLDPRDLNADGTVDAADAARALQAAGGLAATDGHADMDGDGHVSLEDAARLARYVSAPESTEEVLTILHTNDMHGHVLSNSNLDSAGPGGLARLNTLARPIRAGMPNVLYLDAGDNAQATPTEFYARGVTMFSAMNAAGFDASTLGNHEFDWGQQQTARLIAQARFPMLAANVRDTRTGQVYGGARESVTFRRGPLRIAVFGLTTPGTVSIEWPPTISHVRFEDPTEAARRLVPELRKTADMVIALSHLGYNADRALAAAVPGINVIIGGHSHTTLTQHAWVGDTILAQTGSYANNLGRMDLLLRRDGARWSVASVNGKDGRWWADQPNPPLGASYPTQALLPVTENVPYDPAIRDGYQGAFNQVAIRLNTPIAAVPRSIAGSGSATTPRPLPSTMAELLRKRLGADAALMPSLSANLPAGNATVRSVYTIYGGYTRQNVVLVRATGADIRAAVLAAYATEGQYPVYFGGLGGAVTRAGAGATWENPTVNGMPLQDSRYYLVASGSYPLMNYPSLRDSPMVSDDAGWVKPLLAEAMQAEKTITPYAGLSLP